MKKYTNNAILEGIENIKQSILGESDKSLKSYRPSKKSIIDSIIKRFRYDIKRLDDELIITPDDFEDILFDALMKKTYLTEDMIWDILDDKDSDIYDYIFKITKKVMIGFITSKGYLYNGEFNDSVTNEISFEFYTPELFQEINGNLISKSEWE